MNEFSILVVEDEALIAVTIIHILSSRGYTVHKPVARGEDAINSVINQKPDLVLMDIELAGAMNGIETAEKIRAIADIPIVYLTAYTDDVRLKRALHTEPYGYLVKPVQNRELHATIGMALYKHALDRKLRESEERFRDLITTTADIIWQTDEQAIFTYVSPQVEEILGYRPDELIGRDQSGFLEPSSAGVFKADEMSSRSVISQDSYWHHKNGHNVILESRAKPFFNSHGIFSGFRGIDRDITDRRRTEEFLVEANQKVRLLTGLTRHDILNKITAVQGLQDLALESSDPAEVQEYILRANRAGEQMKAIIGFTREYENFGNESSGWLKLREITESAMAEVSIGEVTIKNLIPGDIEVYGEPVLRKVFTTLLENATTHGKHTTKISLFLIEQEKNLIIVCEDDGIGIKKDEKKYIFDKGYGNNTGIGLFLSHEILAITGLSIRERGKEGKGARFEIIVPYGKFRKVRG